MNQPLNLDQIDGIAARATTDPFHVSDCEGSLQVWRESALTHVRRDDTGQITMYSFPSSYRPTDQVIDIDLDSWDPGEDEMDDVRRQDITDLVAAREALPAMADEIRRLRARVAELERITTPRTLRICACGHGHLAHAVPAPHGCFAFGRTCPCVAYQQLPHDEAVAQLERNRQAAARP